MGFFIQGGQPSISYCQGGVWHPPTLPHCISTANGLGNTFGNPTHNFMANNIGCGPAIQPLNGNIQYNGVMNMGTYSFGTSATLSCNGGIL